ncbi:hypothetical protein [Streptantibioticus ferralitis]|uniref:Uncharacterized protein n=1 Tax=Streptantibioticus ferralitis TaxID=236510 RepID=A0ABT5Z4X2_9ACTN|nr:hypothetical protein [Streptantibioticus ferralitis]MDF2258874.1 hypothetical protein [Streptantibioticus ferralitis]
MRELGLEGVMARIAGRFKRVEPRATARAGEVHRAIAGLVSDRAAQRTTRHDPSTELVGVRATAC